MTDRDIVPPDFVQAAYRERLPEDEASALDLLFALRTCAQRVNADLHRWMGANAVTPGRMRMLLLLWARGGPIRQADLGPLLQVSRPSVSELVDTMEREGLIVRKTDPAHQLRFLVSLTAHGERVADELLTTNSARLCRTFADMSPATRYRLARTLDRIARTEDGDGSDSAG
ncbi:MarR family winged helix-turn-helix transcriptional regulator [Roseomonas sp. NAR14]|uniref:MarR family winged helix-turn-helix transcriptional regulator n=1 Tax=Roseomonas acroporae TaxID=2937791 RepID=A0A9X1YKN8_9PROT|nr:MarR family winged helix-turn-helix transcriptional regulator [Roseomonas acroporae]MCK8787756.1 MarR family winged helix-turn-helix transcriptional regulator [Roseomonas acroporae]